MRSPPNQAVFFLRPWQVLGAVIAVIQMALFVAVLAFLVVAETGRGFGYGLSGVIAVLEFASWVSARAALARVPGSFAEDAYTRRPLRTRDRFIVSLNLGTTFVSFVMFAAILPMHAFRHDRIAGVIVLAISYVPGGMSLWRVRSKNSWLAISRIPSLRWPPRRTTSAHLPRDA